VAQQEALTYERDTGDHHGCDEFCAPERLVENLEMTANVHWEVEILEHSS
jgi:hypothetical protein